jgi:hypothetical protein
MMWILAGGWVPLAGATLERLTLDDVTAKSMAIVRGKVISSYASFRGPIIYTHYEVQVSEQHGTSGSSLDVVVPGGTANNLICARSIPARHNSIWAASLGGVCGRGRQA